MKFELRFYMTAPEGSIYELLKRVGPPAQEFIDTLQEGCFPNTCEVTKMTVDKVVEGE